jgi:ribonucleotide monophosphatase NagD (HAD superfamily)
VLDDAREPASPGGAGFPTADRYIIRLDGILLGNGSARDSVATWLRSIAGRYALVSSNSRDTARTMTAKLRRAGVEVPEQRIVLAGEEALRFTAARYPGARCKVLASRVLAHAARSHGLELVQDNAEVILLGRDSAWTYRDLALVVHELARGARLIASNSDMTCLGHGGRPIPDTGAILASIEAAVADRSGIIRFSRSATLQTARQRLGGAEGEALVISHQAEDCDIVATMAGLRCVGFAPMAPAVGAAF